MQIQFWIVLIFLTNGMQAYNIVKLKKEVRLQSMLMDFDAVIIENREKLLKQNGIAYDDFIFIKKEENDKTNK